MTEREFVEIIARALIMVLRAINRRYGFSFWILSREERRCLSRLAIENADVRKMLDKL